MPAIDDPITKLLQDLNDGVDPDGNRLAAAVLDRLRAIAYSEMSGRSKGPVAAMTIEPGVLAADALMGVLAKKPSFENRRHFFSYATQIMVRALIDYQRERSTQRRGGGLVKVTLSRVGGGDTTAIEVESLPPILERLGERDPRKAEIVQLRVFWGLEIKEIATALDISISTVERDWRFAKRWMSAQLRHEQAGQTPEAAPAFKGPGQ